MIRLAAYCGLRASEIAKVHGCDWDGQYLTVVGKGGRRRLVPVFDDTLKIALRKTNYYLFPGPKGHLTAGTVTKLVSNSLPDGWTCHTLRHRYATQAYAGTRDLFAVQTLLGHSKPETTRRYVQLGEDQILQAAIAANRVA